MRRILIADDERVDLLMLQSMFSRLFPNTFEIMTAENGRQAVAIIKSFEPEIAILDIEMPGINGLEVAQKIRWAFPHAVLFFLTAHEVFTYAQQACDAGATGYLLKPISDEMLIRSVQKALERLTAQEYSQRDHLLTEQQTEECQELCTLIYQSLLEEGTCAALSRFRDFCCRIDATVLLQQLLLHLEAQAVRDLGRSLTFHLPKDLKYRDIAGITAWAEHSFLQYRACYEEMTEENHNFGVLAIRQYIRDHYASEISLAEVAAAMGYSETYFSRLFCQHFGQSFTAYLTEVRMQAAQSLLIATNRSINHIGEAVGYRDPNYFSKAFRKATGFSPSEFRSSRQGRGGELR